MSVVRIIEVYVFKYMRILSEHWKLSVIERCPYQEVRLYYEPLYHALQIWQLYVSAQNKQQAEIRLFLQIYSGRILDIVGRF